MRYNIYDSSNAACIETRQYQHVFATYHFDKIVSLKGTKKEEKKRKREIEVTRTEVPLIPRVDATIRMIMGTRAAVCVGLHLFNFRD